MRVLDTLYGAATPLVNKTTNLFAILLASAAFAACSTDEPEAITPPRLVPVPITITTEKPDYYGGTPPADAGTRAIDWEAINNLDILVFNGETRVYRKYFTSSELGQGMTLDVPEGTGLVAYAFANVASNVFADIKTLTDLNNATCTIAAWDDIAKWSTVPMSGRSSSFNVVVGGTAPSISFTLRRIVAQLNITLTGPSGVTISSMKLVNLPKKTYYVSRPLDTERQLADDNTARTDKDAVVAATPTDWIAESGTQTAKTYTFYLFENRPGISTNTNEAKKGAKSNDTRCTYLFVTGEDDDYDMEWTIYLGSDATSNYNIKRNCVYTINATLKNNSVSDVRVVAVAKGINLSATETANCYIISKANEKYVFDATVRGNGYAATSAFPSITTSIAKNGSYTASVLWSMGGAGATSSGLIKDVKYSNGKISFTSANTTKNGNAVIVLKDGSGNILWSWHIWMNTAFNAANDQDYGTGSFYNGKVKMMPYNLGAVNTTNTAVSTNAFDDGLLYQWGRKDPFLGGVGYTGTTNPTKGTHYYYAGSASTDDFNYNAGTSGTVELAYNNPTSFYTGDGSPISRNYDWESGSTNYDNLWGNGSGSTYAEWDGDNNKKTATKTLFDPCPPGYKVAPRNTWSTNFASVSGLTFNKGYAFKYKGTTATTFYSASGLRFFTNGILTDVGKYGYCWSSSPRQSGYRGGGNLYFDSGKVSPLISNVRAYSLPVRCAQQ
jgi:hypothetical protein